MGTPIRRGSNALIEQPDSPRWEFGDTITCTRRFQAAEFAIALAAAPMKGAVGTGVVNGLRVSNSQVSKVRGGMGVLTISYESQPGAIPSQGAELPDDEAEIVNEKIEHAIARHPRYAALSIDLLSDIQTAVETTDDAKYQAAFQSIFSSPQSELGFELLKKLLKGETHYLIYAPVYRLVTHSWTAPINLQSGGFVQQPPNDPIVAPVGYQWMREGDRLSFNGSLWVTEKKWIAAPEWDPNIYAQA
jgi:hypothetical protein